MDYRKCDINLKETATDILFKLKKIYIVLKEAFYYEKNVDAIFLIRYAVLYQCLY